MRILVPLDGSPLAERAVAPAALLAYRSTPPASLMLLWVDAHDQVQATVAEEFSPDVAADVPDRTSHQLPYLQRLCELPQLVSLQVTIQIAAGIPSMTIPRVAQEQGMDLIVMVSQIMTTVDAAMWGSVTEAVARSSPVPTLIIRPEGPSFPDIEQSTPLTILLPLDETPFAEAAVPQAALLAQSCHGKVLLYHVVPEDTDIRVQHQRGEQAYDYLDQIAIRLEDQGIRVSWLLGYGDVAANIASVMQQGRADVITIATHGQSGLSVTENVLHHISAPMLVVHPASE
jgi:nucleotide-binding universal stress UspA family protein